MNKHSEWLRHRATAYSSTAIAKPLYDAADEIDALENRISLAMKLVNDLGGDNQYFHDRAQELLKALLPTGDQT